MAPGVSSFESRFKPGSLLASRSGPILASAEGWDLSGAREDLKVFFTIGYRVAQANTYPEWKPGNEFRAKREAMLNK